MTEYSSGRRWWPLVAICLGTFMLLVDVTIVGVALPQMSRDLHTQLSSLILSFRVSQGRDLRRPVVDSVAGGTLAA